jgi:hypothetical protein
MIRYMRGVASRVQSKVKKVVVLLNLFEARCLLNLTDEVHSQAPTRISTSMKACASANTKTRSSSMIQ